MNSKSFKKYIDEKLLPFAMKMSESKYLSVIRDGMVAATPLALLGGLTLILTSIPVDLETMKPTNFIYSFLINWKLWANDHGLMIELLYRSSMGIMAFFICISIARSLSKYYDLDAMQSQIIAGVSFMVAAAPSNLAVMTSVIEGAGSVEEVLESQTMVIPMNFLGAEGIFTAIVVGILTTEITRFLIVNDIRIKMPDTVPYGVQSAFSSIIPLFVSTISVFLFSLLIQRLTNGLLIPEVLGKVMSPLVVAVDSPMGIVIISVITQFLWFIGLHGSSIVSGIVGAFELGNLASNAEFVSTGAMAPHIYTEPFRAFYMIIGGAGATLALNLLLMFSKSEQLKTLGRVGIIPSIFNINEPIIFGVPLIFNFTLLIPFVLVQTVNGLLSYFAMNFNLIGKTYNYVHWATPSPIGAMLSSYDWRAFIFIIGLIVIDILIWYPFFKAYEKQLLLEEREIIEEKNN